MEFFILIALDFKKFNGEFDIIDETGSEGLPNTDLATSFEINFPIIETEENE